MTQTVLSEATQRLRWRRVLLKVSGEAFAGERRYGIDAATVAVIAREIASIHAMGVEMAVVVGGGNIIRGEEAAASGMERSTADHMGMLATIQNALALQDALEKIDVLTRVQSAIVATAVAEPFIRRRAIRHLEKGRVVILAAGTGHPYFSTDTAAALRALELKAEAVLKATNVDGVYDKDPKLNHDAKKFAFLTYEYAIEHKLGIMDLTAFTLCMENNLPIIVFNIGAEGNMQLAAMGENIGTTVGRDG
ncbi:MAG: UMP kinase [Armatimonadetes bacterium]|nr:UMP kinase [Armatimonadota bacterium]